jgi:hypothetical protein
MRCLNAQINSQRKIICQVASLLKTIAHPYATASAIPSLFILPTCIFYMISGPRWRDMGTIRFMCALLPV